MRIIKPMVSIKDRNRVTNTKEIPAWPELIRYFGHVPEDTMIQLTRLTTHHKVLPKERKFMDEKRGSSVIGAR